MMNQKGRQQLLSPFLYKENHAIVAWEKRAALPGDISLPYKLILSGEYAKIYATKGVGECFGSG